MMMKLRMLGLSTAVLAVVVALLLSATGLVQAAHVCKATGGHSCEAAEAAAKLVTTHGGLDKWAAAPSVSYKHTMVAPFEPDDPWVSVEIVEQGARREYQEWPLDHAVVAFDGKQVWSKDWKRLNPPKFMVNMAYYFVNLPWLTQDPGVNLVELGTGTLPGGDEKTYDTVKMTFDPGVGEASEDYYILFIDRDTGLLKGTEYIVTYGAMLDLMGLPTEATYLGPLTKVFDDFKVVDGLTVPTSYKTYAPNGQVYGEHLVEGISFRKRFDESVLAMPEGAVIDESSAQRKSKM